MADAVTAGNEHQGRRCDASEAHGVVHGTAHERQARMAERGCGLLDGPVAAAVEAPGIDGTIRDHTCYIYVDDLDATYKAFAAAKVGKITCQWAAEGRGTGTDANAIQLARGGVAAGLISVPNRYMHSPVEVVHLDDLNNAARILAEFCSTVTAETNWIP